MVGSTRLWHGFRAGVAARLDTATKQRVRALLRVAVEGLLIVTGALLMALAVDVFLEPNNVVPGGFTALAIFANRLWSWPTGLTLLGMNIPFLLIGTKVLGREFGPKTLFATVLVSLAIDGLRPYVPTVQGDPLLYVAYGGLLYGLGMALVFRANATTGGTEIPAKLLEHLRGIRMARSLLVMDLLILAGAASFFGLAPALYALITAWVMAQIIDRVELGLNASRSVFIVSEHAELLRAVILQEIGRGVTLLTGEGGYTGSPRAVLFTVVNRRQVNRLRALVSAADPAAFVVINPSNDVHGEGFQPLPMGRGAA